MNVVWPTQSAARLFQMIFPALQILPADLTWSLGGGTALAMWLGHRVSDDIDLFFESSKALKLLSPQQNRLTRNISKRWQEPGHYLKFEVVGIGEIDILVTREWTASPTVHATTGTIAFDIQRPAEILARKIAYRAIDFKPRDFFDLAATALFAPDEIRRLRPILSRNTQDLRVRWSAVSDDRSGFLPTAKGNTVIERLPYVIERLLRK